ncbi:MAG TPA: PEP-CTERM sorting domain-containing protein [Cyanothece sp. UBA12306]|nr:PEP-CTERM sorting domain-containing protein [Cyanothece sp. UBA12306]
MKNSSILSTFLATSCSLSVLSIVAPTYAQINVDTEISFLVDISGSVDSSEYDLQVNGYINALNNLDFTGTNFAANFIVWSGASQQEESVGWTHIFDNASAQNFATSISNALLPENTERPFNGNTAPGSAINFAIPLFGLETGGADNGFISNRQIIDVSGDGSENEGNNTAAARDAALLAGVDAINGLPILTDDPNLDIWYQNNVIGGTGSFLQIANDFDDFESAITQKITREIIRGVPEPSSVLGLIGVGVFAAKSLVKRSKSQ